VWDHTRARREIVRRELLSLLWWGGRHALAHPRSLLMRLFERDTMSSGESQQEYELRPIVLAADARGSGAATALVERLFEDARARGHSRMHLFVNRTNFRAQAFYAKVGFTQMAADRTPETEFLRFEREL
jgi:ribosomal protein S18 acetylase RimI-like enzyme